MTAREHVDLIWNTSDLNDLSDFNIPLSSAVNMMEKYSKANTLDLSNIDKSYFAIFNKGKILENVLFKSNDAARNYIKMKYPKRTFKELNKNVFVCAHYGTKFIIEEQYYHQQL
jgi:hypothetical protein